MVVSQVYILVLLYYRFSYLEYLIILEMINFDIILSMTWLSPYHVILNYKAKNMVLDMLVKNMLEGKVVYRLRHIKFISFIQAKKIVESDMYPFCYIFNLLVQRFSLLS